MGALLSQSGGDQRLDSLIVFFVGIISLGIIRTVSAAVGPSQLKPIYEEVKLKLGTTPAVELIDITIALNHGGEFPRAQLLKHCDTFSEKWFPKLILQQLVAYHFSMFHVDSSVAKSIGSKIGVDMKSP